MEQWHFVKKIYQHFLQLFINDKLTLEHLIRALKQHDNFCIISFHTASQTKGTPKEQIKERKTINIVKSVCFIKSPLAQFSTASVLQYRIKCTSQLLPSKEREREILLKQRLGFSINFKTPDLEENMIS